ncbi:hypothetical protein KIS1582_2882 [Cytobacillus firmus]|uniref:Uncharacterized protein n=1 Tax=Cytobacillus firmus TaxID=1399 RepID=A0A800MVN9_CYTFI|nr:hypothetical protein KIS1582_2882 [Cytobacillus firmus]
MFSQLGIRPEVAQTAIQLGIDFTDIITEKNQYLILEGPAGVFFYLS